MAKKILNVLLYVMVLIVLTGSLSACNTFEGIGRDVRSAGDAMTGAAQKSH